MKATALGYWLLAGAVIGLGYLLLFEGGVLLVLLGMGLALRRAARAGGGDSGARWWAWVSCPDCTCWPATSLPTLLTNVSPTGYLAGVALFLALAGAGAIWGLLETRRGNRPEPAGVINDT